MIRILLRPLPDGFPFCKGRDLPGADRVAFALDFFREKCNRADSAPVARNGRRADSSGTARARTRPGRARPARRCAGAGRRCRGLRRNRAAVAGPLSEYGLALLPRPRAAPKKWPGGLHPRLARAGPVAVANPVSPHGFALAANVFRSELKRFPTVTSHRGRARANRPGDSAQRLARGQTRGAVRRAVLALPPRYREPRGPVLLS